MDHTHVKLDFGALNANDIKVTATVNLNKVERRTRGIKLTEAGKFFANEAGAVLARADQALKAVRAVARGETGKLRVRKIYSKAAP